MEKDILAVCFIMGGSSFGRADNIPEAVRLCKISLERDWGSVFMLDGKTMPINCYDVTGNDVCYFQDHEIIGDNKDEFPVQYLECREVVLKPYKHPMAY
jgi:hypothetical protein